MSRLALPAALAVAFLPAPTEVRAQSSDTLVVEVGSPGIDGRVFRPHAARVRRHVAGPDSPVAIEWVNELTLGDSAGRAVMRWVTSSRPRMPDGSTGLSRLEQTYDAVTLEPYGLRRTLNGQVLVRLTFRGTHITGVQRSSLADTLRPVDLTLDRPGFIASASDIVPVAAGLEAGRVVKAPVWGPGMTRSEGRIFTVLREMPIDVEGTRRLAWAVEERSEAEGRLLATWYLLRDSPYMVAGDVYTPDGRTIHFTEVSVPR